MRDRGDRSSRRFLLYTHEFPPDAGGAGTYTAYLATGLSRRGHDVTVLAHRPGGAATPWDDTQPYRVVPLALPGDMLARGGLGAVRMAQWHRRTRPDAILVTEATAQVAGALATRLFGLPVAATCHGSEVPWFFGPQASLPDRLTAAILRDFYRRTPAILCVSRATEELLSQAFPPVRGRTRVVHNGIDTEKFAPVDDAVVADARRDLGLEGPVLLTVARLIPEKGHDVVLRALARLQREGEAGLEGAQYLVVGSGPDRGRLERLAKELSVETTVRFMGKVPDDTLNALYQAADVFVMPSRAGERVEGFGLVFVEAGAYSKPSIAGRTGGVPEVVDHGVTGLLVDPEDVADVAEAIRALAADPSRAREMGRNARARVESEFNAVAMAGRTVEALDAAGVLDGGDGGDDGDGGHHR